MIKTIKECKGILDFLNKMLEGLVKGCKIKWR